MESWHIPMNSMNKKNKNKYDKEYEHKYEANMKHSLFKYEANMNQHILFIFKS